MENAFSSSHRPDASYLNEFLLTKPWALTLRPFVHLPHFSTHSSSLGSARASLWRPSQDISTLRQRPSCFFAGYDWSFFNNSPSMSLQPTVSSAHNHPSAFCPLRAGKLETCNSSHFEWEVSLAFQTTVCTKWQFSGDLGGALPAKEWIRPLTDNAVGPSSLSTWVLASSLKSGGRVKPTVPRPFPTRCSFQRSFASLKEQSFPVVSLVVRGPAWSKALHVQLFSQLWLSKPLSSL